MFLNQLANSVHIWHSRIVLQLLLVESNVLQDWKVTWRSKEKCMIYILINVSSLLVFTGARCFRPVDTGAGI